MTCDQAIELLPWHLNGTLEAGETAEVRQHLETCERCRAALAETRQAWSVFAQHIPSQDLVALAWGQSPSGIDPETAAEHLAACAECAAELELARMSRRLEEEDNVAVFPPRPKTDPGRSYRRWRAAAIAASLAGVIAASGWFRTAQQPQQAVVPPVSSQPAATPPQAPAGQSGAESQIAALSQRIGALLKDKEDLQGQVRKKDEQIAQLKEQPDVTAVPGVGYVDPLSVARGPEDEKDKEKVVAASNTVTTLILRSFSKETGAHEKHVVEILSEGGVPEKTKPVQRDPNGPFLLALKKGELKPGAYTLQVYGMKGGQRDPEPDGTYKIRIQPQP